MVWPLWGPLKECPLCSGGDVLKFKRMVSQADQWPSMLKVRGLNLIKTNVNFEQRYLWVSTEKYHVLKELINYKQLKENINKNDKQFHVEDK
jgi:hypothetical protein